MAIVLRIVLTLACFTALRVQGNAAQSGSRFDAKRGADVLASGKEVRLSRFLRSALKITPEKPSGRIETSTPLPGANLDYDTIVNGSVTGGFPASAPSVAVDPHDPAHIFASANDYRFGDSEPGLYSALPGAGFTDTIEGDLVGGFYNYQRAGSTGVGIDRYGTDYIASIGVADIYPIENVGLYVARSQPVARGRYVDLPSLVDRHGNLVDDADSLAVDAVDGSLYEDTVYSAFTQFDRQNPELVKSPIIGAYARDGVHFSRTVYISHPSPNLCPADLGACADDQGSAIAIGRHGIVYVAYENFDTGVAANQILISVSYDGGRSFRSPVRVALVDDVASRGFVEATSYPSLAVNRTTGRLYVVWDAYTGHGQAEGVMISSSPNGEAGTWTAPQIASVPLLGAYQYLPAVSVATATGSVFVSYYDDSRFNSTGYDYVYRRFTSDLRSGTATTRVSAAPVNVVLTEYELGERSSSAPTPNGARAVWTGTSSGAADIETAALR